MKTKIVTRSEKETIAFAKKFFAEILRGAEDGKAFDIAQDKPLIFYLEGELGAGKTQFVKGIAAALGLKEKITSPTFVLMRRFTIPQKALRLHQGKKHFFHIDCYRIYDAEDARQIGMEEILQSPRVVAAVEWAERIRDIIPRPYWELRFEHVGENTRKISIRNVKK